ncbi:MAG: response regulator [Planctomycetales bacterium]|nr:response regulator [Planctomycetales bacterium]
MANILVVDDERIVRESLLSLLHSHGRHSGWAAGTAEEAREMAQSQSFDLLLIDWMLSDNVCGLQVASLVRESTPSLPVIFLSGLISSDLQSQVGSFRRSWFLSKPCDFMELLRTIELALQLETTGGNNEPEVV